jgi:hypothetical protein
MMEAEKVSETFDFYSELTLRNDPEEPITFSRQEKVSQTPKCCVCCNEH